MSDDLPPVDGCVHPDNAGRLVVRGTWVNLDALDFAPILTALKHVVESARQLAKWEADERIGNARLGDARYELLSQLTKRRMALESALATANLTEITACAFEDERKTAAFVLLELCAT